MKKNKHSVKKKNKKKKVWIALVIVLVIIFGIVGAGYVYLDKIKSTKLIDSELKTTKKENIKGEDVTGWHEVKNILLLGVDNQENASDSNMVISIDGTSKVLKITSLMRDTYVDLGADRKIKKLNYAYHYGGTKLSIQTINEIFKLDITDYIKVDFDGLVHIIDKIGGIEIDVNEKEFKAINSYAKNIAGITNAQYTPIARAGKQVLNGQQATAYCRFRYDVNSDYGRTQRQRNVIEKIFQKFKDKSFLEYPQLISDILPYVETSLSKIEMIRYGSDIASYGKNEIKESRCPYDGLHSDSTIDGIYYMQWDKEKNIEKLHKFIYSE